MPSERKSQSVYLTEYGVDIYRTDDYIYINSISIPVEKFTEFASLILQTVAGLKVETIEYKIGPGISASEIDKIYMDNVLPKIKDIFERDDTFFRKLKK